MSNVPEYITSAYQPFSAFDSIFSSSGNFTKTSGIIENFLGENIPYEKTVNGVVKYTGTITRNPITGSFNNQRRGWNGEAVLSLNDKLFERSLDNPYTNKN